MLVQVRSPRFHLLVAPEQFQFTPLNPPEDQQRLIEDKVGKIVRELPHTPYTALGLNFQWHLEPEHVTVEQLSRRLFFADGSKLHAALDSEDAKLGGRISRDFQNFRMKLDVRPVNQDMGDDGERYMMQLGFNFHRDIPRDNAVEVIAESLQHWEEVRQKSNRVSSIAAEEDIA